MEETVIIHLTQEQAQEYFMLKRGWDKKKEAALFYPFGWYGDRNNSWIKILSDDEALIVMGDKIKEIQEINFRLEVAVGAMRKENGDLTQQLNERAVLHSNKKKWYQW